MFGDIRKATATSHLLRQFAEQLTFTIGSAVRCAAHQIPFRFASNLKKQKLISYIDLSDAETAARDNLEKFCPSQALKRFSYRCSADSELLAKGDFGDPHPRLYLCGDN